jgi:peptidoglycan/xylan/chitin deacetylase (PgdA/CDA1 family)
VTVTFDDGYRDLYKHAFPVLRRYEIPATIYLIGRCMETGEAPWYDRIFVALVACSRAVLEVELDSPRRFLLASPEQRAAAAWEIVTYLREVPNRQRLAWCAAFDRDVQVPQEELEGRMLDWQQVRAMARGGVFFGAHTMTHPVLSRLEASSLDAELSASKQLLESGLDASVEDFAYPFGKPEDCSREAEEAIRRCGYKSAVNTSPGLNTGGSNPHALYRYQIDEEDSLACFAFDLSRLFLEGPAPAPSAGERSASEAHAVGAGARAERIGS